MHRVEGDLAYTKGGYCFDRRIFTGYIIVVFLLIFAIMITTNVGHREFYLHCPLDTPMGHGLPCRNTCYQEYDNVECGPVVDREMLPPGFELGTPPSLLLQERTNALWFLIVSLFLLAFLINHRVHNKGRMLSTIFEVKE